MPRFGCGKKMQIFVPKGFSYKEVTVSCGSTSANGGVNQCDQCVVQIGQPPLPEEDEGDLEWFERIHAGDE